MGGRLGRLSYRHHGPRIRADGVTRLTLAAPPQSRTRLSASLGSLIASTSALPTSVDLLIFLNGVFS